MSPTARMTEGRAFYAEGPAYEKQLTLAESPP